MFYKTNYSSVFGNITAVSNGTELIALNFEGQKNYLNKLPSDIIENDNLEIFKRTKKWLHSYFKKEKTNDTELFINPMGTEFQKEIWNILLKIPYGKTMTYKEIADIYKKEKNIDKMSYRAVGSAIAHNPILIIIPCHRVIKKNKAIGGYIAGIELKKKLLEHEGNHSFIS